MKELEKEKTQLSVNQKLTKGIKNLNEFMGEERVSTN